MKYLWAILLQPLPGPVEGAGSGTACGWGILPAVWVVSLWAPEDMVDYCAAAGQASLYLVCWALVGAACSVGLSGDAETWGTVL